MSTLLWIAVGVAAYVVLLVIVLTLLAAAKHDDEKVARSLSDATPAWADAPHEPHERRRRAPEHGVEASSRWLGRRTADAQTTLGVERIAVVLRDPDDPDAWIVEACGGVRDLCGTMVAVATDSGAGALLVEGTEDRQRWSVASAPIVVDGATAGEVAVATRRSRGLQPRDVEFLERFAGVLAGHVRSRPTRPRASGETSRTRRPPA